MWRRRSLVIVALALALMASSLEGISVVLMLPLLQLITDGGAADSLSSNALLQPITLFFAELPGEWRLPGILLCIWLVTVVKNMIRYFSDVSINKLQLQTGYDLREKCINRFLELDLLYYNRSKLGDLLSTVNEHVQRSERLASSMLEMATNVLTISILTLLLFTLSSSLTILTILGLGVIALLLQPILRLVKQQSRATATVIDTFTSAVTEIVTGIRVVKGFYTEAQEARRAKQVLKNRYETEMKAFKYNSVVIPATETLGITMLLALMGGGAMIWADSPDVMLPLLFTYTLALLRVLPRINHLNSLRSSFSLVSGSLESVDHFLETTTEQHLKEGWREFEGLKSSIVFDQVSFTFPGNSEPTLRDLSLVIPQGKMTAIVGPSGSGKSTLMDLVMRFFDPDDGCIAVDGIDLREFRIGTWRNAVAMVSQDTFLFHASVRENIAYGSPMATEEEIIEATKKAYAYDFIQQLPHDFDTVVGNRGTKLSGGQRQRIAIARAFLRNPDILILDEATSALDTNSEQIVQRAIEELAHNRTVIVIAHRPSAVVNANNIIALDQGQVVGSDPRQSALTNSSLASSFP